MYLNNTTCSRWVTMLFIEAISYDKGACEAVGNFGILLVSLLVSLSILTWTGHCNVPQDEEKGDADDKLLKVYELRWAYHSKGI